jgi:hypothetical protein
VLVQQRFQFRRRISAPCWNPHERQPGCEKDAVYKLVALLAVWALMALVVQLYPDRRAQASWFAQTEINVLPVNPVEENPVLAWVAGFREEEVCQRHLRTNEETVGDYRPQHLAKALFRWRQKIIAEGIREFILCLFRFRREECDNPINNVLDVLV